MTARYRERSDVLARRRSRSTLTGEGSPVRRIDLAREQLQTANDEPPAREETYFATSKLNDEELPAGEATGRDCTGSGR